LREEKQLLGFLGSLFEDHLTLRADDVCEPIDTVYVGQTPFTAAAVLQSDETAYESEYATWLQESWIPEQKERLEGTLALHGNRERFSDLTSAARNQQLVPLVGSGMSVPSGLVTWSEFLRRICSYSKVDAEELEDLLANGRFEEAAEQIKDRMPPRLFDERIDHDLRIPGDRHVEGAVRFLPSLQPSVILTMNLDNVLESTFEDQGQTFSHVLHGTGLRNYRTLKNPKESFLLKLHGDSREPESRVITATEYDAAYAEGSAIRLELSLLSRSYSLLCLGCSLANDRMIDLLHEVATEDRNIPKHFAILRDPGDDVGRLSREHFLCDRGIFPIWYDGDHDGAIQSLLVGVLLDIEGMGDLLI